MRELHGAIRRLSRGKPNIFVFCLTRNRDLLSQWRAYGQPGNWYSIGFDAPALDEIIRTDPQMQIAAVTYESHQHWDLMNRMEILALEKATKGSEGELEFGRSLYEVFLDVAPVMKHPDFYEEKEWRLIVCEKKRGSLQVKHRSGRSMLVPYVVVNIRKEGRPLPIRHIIIGPHQHPKLEREAVKKLCQENHLKVEVSHSKIPYRGW